MLSRLAGTCGSLAQICCISPAKTLTPVSGAPPDPHCLIKHFNSPTPRRVKELTPSLAVGELCPQPEPSPYRIIARERLRTFNVQIGRILLTGYGPDMDRPMEARRSGWPVTLNNHPAVRIVLSHPPSLPAAPPSPPPAAARRACGGPQPPPHTQSPPAAALPS